jgi:hypothetical protein
MSQAAQRPDDRCINCGRSEDELPLSTWRMAGQTFAICPDCLPYLIHQRNAVMPKWGLATRPATSPDPGGEDAER